MMKKMKHLLLGNFLVLAGLSSSSTYGAPITFIGQSDIGTTGYTISSAGLYVLTDSINFASTGTAIIISSDNVILDLNNKHLVGTANATGIYVSGAYNNTIVKNGFLYNFANGFNAGAGPLQLALENLEFSQKLSSNIGTGILISSGKNISLTNCLTTGFIVGTEIDSSNVVAIKGLISTYNQSFSGSSPFGLTLSSCQSVSIQDSQIANNSSVLDTIYGIQLSSCSQVSINNIRVTKNTTFGGTSAIGMFVSGTQSLFVSNSTFMGNSGNGNGIGVSLDGSTSSDIRFVDCIFDTNSASTTIGAGLYINVEVDGLICRNCSFSRNLGLGSNVVSTGGIYATGIITGGKIENCTATNNGGPDSAGNTAGFWLQGAGQNSVLFENCMAEYNVPFGASGSGFRFESGVTGCVIKNCRAFNNASNGFDDLNASQVNLYTGNQAFGQGSNNYAGISTSSPLITSVSVSTFPATSPTNSDVLSLSNLSFS